ncbi:MAG: alpha-amylase, partial [Spirochaetota bacterium]
MAAKQNGTMLQAFHWYLDADSGHWSRLAASVPDLAKSGITALWLPPAFKGTAGKYDVGYGPYDLYDLGEFLQKETVPTKYGTKDEYVGLIKALHEKGIHSYADIVLNHKAGADAAEPVRVRRVHAGNRSVEYGEETEIDAWTSFRFPGRSGKYSSFVWSAKHFDGVDWDQRRAEKAVFKFIKADSSWENVVGDENGNYDYLMFADLDFTEAEVIKETKDWGLWYLSETGIDGFRLDAVKHISFDFFHDWLETMRQSTGRELFTVGEFWCYKLDLLRLYLAKSGGHMSLFDAPLHLNFYHASRNESFDLSRLFDGSLVQDNP